jgi:hypothetical protein
MKFKTVIGLFELVISEITMIQNEKHHLNVEMA